MTRRVTVVLATIFCALVLGAPVAIVLFGGVQL